LLLSSKSDWFQIGILFNIGSGIRIAIDNQSVTVGGRVAIWEK
jgi:hypothetical protein